MSLPDADADAAAGASGKGKTPSPSGAAADANPTTVKKNWESRAKEAVRTAREAMKDRINPACLRLAFYDALSHNSSSVRAYGPTGAIRSAEGLEQELLDVVKIIDDIRAKHENVKTCLSYADLFQLIGVEAVKVYSNMDIEFHPGRQDILGAIVPYMVDKSIQDSEIKGDKARDLRSAFYPRGFNDKEIVALSSAIIYWMNHSLFESDNSEKNKFHLVYGKLEQDQTKDTKTSSSPNATTSTKNSGGTTSTSNEANPIINFSCWKCLLSDTSFRNHLDSFKKDAAKFEEEYKQAHKKLSEIGFRYFPKEIVEYHDIKHGIAFGVAMTIIIGLMGFFYELMRS